MKHLQYILLFFLFVTQTNAQTADILKIKVEKGETVTSIAKKHNVTPADIIKLNPDVQNGISENDILLIPNKNQVKTNPKQSKSKNHIVLPQETLYSLSKLYNVSISDLENANPETSQGLKVGNVITIPGKGYMTKRKDNLQPNASVFHEVKPKETKYAIARQYNITIEQLEKQNPEIANIELPVGYKLLIGLKPEIKNDELKEVLPSVTSKTYVVKPKETLYSISNQFTISQEELIALNPELKQGVIEGMTIKLSINTTVVSVKKEFIDLTKTLKRQQRKKLAILLPFNITKLDQDTINSTKSRLKKDKFLNMTLDFYSGALMAIDSVKKLNVNVDITILDSDETKSTSAVSDLVNQHNLKNMHAVIGPFYQNNVEKTASLLNEFNVPVISPLSNDYSKSYSNLIQATPSANDIKKAIFDFMNAKNGNIIAVVDIKKVGVKQYIIDNHKNVQLAIFTEKGTLDIPYLKSLLVKDKINYVIMETEKTNLILSLTSTLSSSLAAYQIKLVTLSENEALDFEEIDINRLAKLNRHYSSISRPNTTPEVISFDANYKKKYKIVPNQFAIRGFDITFDVLMRLNQEKTFTETLSETATNQIENQFNYVLNTNGGYINKGIYILQYETDLTIKESK